MSTTQNTTGNHFFRMVCMHNAYQNDRNDNNVRRNRETRTRTRTQQRQIEARHGRKASIRAKGSTEVNSVLQSKSKYNLLEYNNMFGGFNASKLKPRKWRRIKHKGGRR